MDFYSDLATMYLEQALSALIFIFVTGSVVLFAVDASKAKKENRKIKAWIKVLFIISLILIALFILGVVFLIFVLGFYIFNS